MRRTASLALIALLAASGARAQASRYRDQIERLEPGSFLVASRELQDPNFRETVVLIVEHAPHQGAIGLVINRPSTVELSRVIGEAPAAPDVEPVFLGGPVEPLQLTALVRSPEPIENADRVLDDIFYSSDRELLEGLASDGDRTFRAYAGYAGWAPGQLELEISVGGWHVVAGRAAVVFEHPTDKIWSRLILLGTAEWARRGAPRRHANSLRAAR